MTPNNLFANHVTSASFSLSLSKTMIIVLVEISEMKGKMRDKCVLKANGIRSIWVPTVRCLEDRGLIFAPDKDWPGRFLITEAGEHVLALLQIAGLVVDAPAPAEKEKTE